MPAPGMVSGSILSSLTPKQKSSSQWKQIANGVELGLYNWLLSPTSQIVGVGVGTVGVGECGGALIVSPNALFMESAFKSNLITGQFTSMLWTSIMVGISKTYGFTGKSPSVGVGTYTGAFVGDPLLLSQSLLGGFKTNGIVGKDVSRICTALAQGIYSHFQVGQVLGSIVGPSGPSASTASAIGKFV